MSTSCSCCTHLLQCSNPRVHFDSCQTMMVLCGQNEYCSRCMTSVYSADGKRKAEIINSSMCGNFSTPTVEDMYSQFASWPYTSRAQGQAMMQWLSIFCDSLPLCTIAKLQCHSDATCSNCAQLIENNNITGAVELCGRPGPNFLPEMYDIYLSNYMSSCTFGTTVGCSFGTATCGQIQNCSECYSEISENGFVQGTTSPVCSGVTSYIGHHDPIYNITDIGPYLATWSLYNKFTLCPRDEAEQLDTCGLKQLDCVWTLGQVCFSHLL